MQQHDDCLHNKGVPNSQSSYAPVGGGECRGVVIQLEEQKTILFVFFLSSFDFFFLSRAGFSEHTPPS